MKAKVLATGLGFPEGPAVDERGQLHIVELAQRRISRVRGGSGVPWVSLPGAPNGIAFGHDYTLYVCDNGGYWPPHPSTGGMAGPGDEPGRVWRVARDGTAEVLVETIDGKALNGPNDLCFDDGHGCYFTDPAWEPRSLGEPRVGDVCFVSASGVASRVHTGLRFPNGLHVGPDGTWLLVGETDTGVVHRFPIIGPGVLGEPQEYVDLGAGTGPDGMCFDIQGRLIVTGSTAGKLFVVAAGGGRIEHEIESEDPCPTNVCFGGPDGRTLFVTEGARGRVVALQWDVPGQRLFPDRGTA